MSVAASQLDIIVPIMKAAKVEATLGPTQGVPLQESQSILETPVIPDNELDTSEHADQRSNQVQSHARLPDVEAAEVISSPPTPVLLISTREGHKMDTFVEPENGLFKFQIEHANSIEGYKQKIKQFLSSAKSRGSNEVFVVHEIDVTADESFPQPVIDGQLVTETELSEPLDCSTELEGQKIGVIYLRCQCLGPYRDKNSARKGFSDHEYDTPLRAPLSGCDVLSIDFASIDVNWQEVQRAFSSLEMNGTKVSINEMRQQIVGCCSGARFRRVSGIPRAELCKASTNSTPDVPTIPECESEEDALSKLQLLSSKSSDEIDLPAPNVCISIIIRMYPKNIRHGVLEDKQAVYVISEQMGCSSENTYILCPDDGTVSEHSIRDHIEMVVESCNKKNISPKWVFVVVSAHGSQAGIHTSDDKKLPVQEVAHLLEPLGGSVLLLYQACRGKGHHPAQVGDRDGLPFVEDLGFASPDIAGCVLPSRKPRMAAIFGSMAGYEAYRNEKKGSWMLWALQDVVRARRNISVPQLAELVQAKLSEQFTDGLLKCQRNRESSYTCYIQIQYIVNEGCEDLTVDTGLMRRSEATERGGGGSTVSHQLCPQATLAELSQLIPCKSREQE